MSEAYNTTSIFKELAVLDDNSQYRSSSDNRLILIKLINSKDKNLITDTHLIDDKVFYERENGEMETLNDREFTVVNQDFNNQQKNKG